MDIQAYAEPLLSSWLRPGAWQLTSTGAPVPTPFCKPTCSSLPGCSARTSCLGCSTCASIPSAGSRAMTVPRRIGGNSCCVTKAASIGTQCRPHKLASRQRACARVKVWSGSAFALLTCTQSSSVTLGGCPAGSQVLPSVAEGMKSVCSMAGFQLAYCQAFTARQKRTLDTHR